MKTSIWVWLILGLVVFGCFEPEPLVRPFFKVVTKPAEPDTSNTAGRITLHGEIQGLDGKTISDYGFLFSEDSLQVADYPTIDSSQYRFGELSDVKGTYTFFEENVLVKEGKKYFIKAFAQMEERLIWGELVEYDYSLGFAFEVTNRINDSIFFKVSLSGLSNKVDVNDFGVLISRDQEKLNFLEADRVSFGDFIDNAMEDSSRRVEFNTTYYFLPYAIGFDTVFADNSFTYDVTDGWKRLNNLDFTIANTVTISNYNSAYLFAGCRTFSIDCPLDLLNQKVYNWTFNMNDSSGTWMDMGWMHDTTRMALAEAVGVVKNDQVFMGFGKKQDSYSSFFVDALMPDAPENSCFPYFATGDVSNMIAFEKDGIIYIGTGSSDEGDENRFFMLAEGNPCFEVEEIDPLPIRREGMDDLDNAGREGAVVLTIGDGLDKRIFVGFGEHGAFPLNDLYEFNPPGSGEEVWSFAGFAEIPTRTEAMSFSVGGRAFVGFGYNAFESNGLYYNDLWEFCPGEDEQWQDREPLPYFGRRSGFAFSLYEKFGFIGGGVFREDGSSYTLNDTWVYFPPEE